MTTFEVSTYNPGTRARSLSTVQAENSRAAAESATYRGKGKVSGGWPTLNETDSFSYTDDSTGTWIVVRKTEEDR